MHKVSNQETPTNFSKSNFWLKYVSLKSTKYSISFRGQKLWNEFLQKELESFSRFQNRINSKLLMIKNETKCETKLCFFLNTLKILNHSNSISTIFNDNSSKPFRTSYASVTLIIIFQKFMIIGFKKECFFNCLG